MSNEDLKQLENNTSDRYNTDTVVSNILNIIVLLLPLFIFFLFTLIILSSTGDALANKFILLAISLSMLNTSIISYYSYVRVVKHLKRDLKWQQIVINCVNDLNPKNGSVLRNDIHTLYRPLLVKILAIGMICLEIVAITTLYIDIQDIFSDYFVIDLTYSLFVLGKTIVIDNFVLVGILTLIVLLLTLPKCILIPVKHDQKQSLFTSEVCKCLKDAGIEASPMESTLDRHPGHILLILLLMVISIVIITMNENDLNLILSSRVLLCVILFVFLYPVMMVIPSHKMNEHILKQWAYEDYLVQLFKNVTGCPVDSNIPHINTNPVSRSLPLGLIFAELFMLVLCGVYLLKTFGLCYDYLIAPAHYKHNLQDCGKLLFSIALNLILIVTVYNAILGIKTGRISAWRKVIRSSMTFCITCILYAFVLTTNSYSHVFDFDPYLSIALLYLLVLMMVLSNSVKQYYTPSGKKIPPTAEWLRYIAIGSLEFEDSDYSTKTPDFVEFD